MTKVTTETLIWNLSNWLKSPLSFIQGYFQHHLFHQTVLGNFSVSYPYLGMLGRAWPHPSKFSPLSNVYLHYKSYYTACLVRGYCWSKDPSIWVLWAITSAKEFASHRVYIGNYYTTKALILLHSKHRVMIKFLYILKICLHYSVIITVPNCMQKIWKKLTTSF